MYRSRFAFLLAMAALAAILIPSTLTAQVTLQLSHGRERGVAYVAKGNGDDDMTWARAYGDSWNDKGYSVQQTTDGGYIATGSTECFATRSIDVYVIKTDAHGDTVWSRTFGGTARDYGYMVQQTTDGGYIVTGTTESFGAGIEDIYLIKLSAGGDTLWTRTLGGVDEEFGYSVRQTADSGYVIVGTTGTYGAGDYDVYLVKTDAEGVAQWSKTYGGTYMDEGYSVQEVPNGGYIIAGYTTSFGAGHDDVYLIRIDAGGDTLWTRTYGGLNNEEGWSVQPTADSGYIIAGVTSSYGAGGGDVYLIKTNALGDTLWTKTLGGADNDFGYSVQQTAGGGYIIAGSTRSRGAGHSDAYLIKTDALGDTLWTRTFGDTGYDAGYSAQQTTDGGYIIAGYTDGFGANEYDVYLIKTDALGNVAVAEPKASPTRAPALSLTCEPNPVVGTTTIRTSYIVPRSSLSVYDASGRLVRSFSLLSSPSSLTWDGTDELGQPLPSGAYFLRLDAGSQHATTRIILQR